jgi:hypothetical protein
MLQPGKKGFESNESNPAPPTKTPNQTREKERETIKEKAEEMTREQR